MANPEPLCTWQWLDRDPLQIRTVCAHRFLLGPWWVVHIFEWSKEQVFCIILLNRNDLPFDKQPFSSVNPQCPSQTCILTLLRQFSFTKCQDDGHNLNSSVMLRTKELKKISSNTVSRKNTRCTRWKGFNMCQEFVSI